MNYIFCINISQGNNAPFGVQMMTDVKKNIKSFFDAKYQILTESEKFTTFGRQEKIASANEPLVAGSYQKLIRTHTLNGIKEFKVQ